MVKANVLVACLFAFIIGNACAQSFPTRPLTLICPSAPASTIDIYIRALAKITTKYLGQPVNVETVPGETNTLGPATMARTARPDGYTLSQLTINSFRIPHMQRVSWDPLRDFTYIVGLAGATFGVVVKSDSQFKSLRDLIEYAKANPGKVRYGLSGRGSTSHLIMEELGFRTNARFLHEPGRDPEAVQALIDGRILVISGTVAWAPYVDSGAFRLLATFGELRSRWNVPTAREQGFDVISYSPFGIVGPKGMDPKVIKVLHDAFNQSLDDPDYAPLLARLDMVDWYKSSEDYADWAVDQFRFQKELLERTIGLGRN